MNSLDIYYHSIHNLNNMYNPILPDIVDELPCSIRTWIRLWMSCRDPS